MNFVSSRQPLSKTFPALIWTALLLIGVIRSQADEYGTMHPEAPAELRQFEFLIGPWDCEVDWLKQDGGRDQGRGTWTGRWMMDGLAIQDDFRDGFVEGYRATTFRAWDQRHKSWRGYWLDGSGRWSRPLIQEETDQGLRLRTSVTFLNGEGENVEVEMRYHFYKFAKRKFSWRQDSSFDGGETWQQGTAKIECQRPTSWTKPLKAPK